LGQACLENESCLEDGIITEKQFHGEIFTPALDELISTIPTTPAGLAALLGFVREQGGAVELIGDDVDELAMFERPIECAVCRLAGLPAPPMSKHLLDREGGEHA
jgi:hypothetical protein